MVNARELGLGTNYFSNGEILELNESKFIEMLMEKKALAWKLLKTPIDR